MAFEDFIGAYFIFNYWTELYLDGEVSLETFIDCFTLNFWAKSLSLDGEVTADILLRAYSIISCWKESTLEYLPGAYFAKYEDSVTANLTLFFKKINKGIKYK